MSGSCAPTSSGTSTPMTSRGRVKNSPCAKFTIRMTPKISVRPNENSMYAAAICRLFMVNCM